jgi:hypothetical protein
MGQLQLMLRTRYLIDTVGLCKVQGKPFTIHEVAAKLDEILQPD